MCWVLIEGLYTGICTVPREKKGGGAVSCMRVIPIDSVTPLGLPEVVFILRFCPPTILLGDHRPVLITNMQLSVQVLPFLPMSTPLEQVVCGMCTVWNPFLVGWDFPADHPLTRESVLGRMCVTVIQCNINWKCFHEELLLLHWKYLPTPFAIFNLLAQTLQHFRSWSLWCLWNI